MSFANQVVVITGASSGIGREMARQLAAQGAKVGLIARRRDRLDEIAAEVRKFGGTVEVEQADVGDRQQVLTAVGRLIERLGPVDILFANAGVSEPTTVEPLNTPEVEKQMRVNYFGVVYAIEAVLPGMLQRRKGHLVAVSSIASFMGMPAHGGYCASKAAVNSFMQSLRYQLRDYKVSVTTICPGFVRTEMTENAQHNMPLLMNCDRAVRKMLGAIRWRSRQYSFPRILRHVMFWANLAPDRAVVRHMRRAGVIQHIPPPATSVSS
jgi:short-subunit dehydrogenase